MVSQFSVKKKYQNLSAIFLYSKIVWEYRSSKNVYSAFGSFFWLEIYFVTSRLSTHILCCTSFLCFAKASSFKCRHHWPVTSLWFLTAWQNQCFMTKWLTDLRTDYSCTCHINNEGTRLTGPTKNQPSFVTLLETWAGIIPLPYGGRIWRHKVCRGRGAMTIYNDISHVLPLPLLGHHQKE